MADIPFHQPALSDLERTYLLQALEGRYWGGGDWVQRLEAKLREIYGREAVVVSSGTAALHLALSLLLGDKGGEVIVPTWTFTATASEVVHAGGVPVLADVNETLHLCAETVEPLISPRTRGIIVMHYAGLPAPLRELHTLCEKYGIWLMEDACHAVPAYYEGRLCGTFGVAATLSFHATKPIAAGQGGAILFAEARLAEKARSLRRHGIRRDPTRPWLYEVEAFGWNYMLSDFQAAVALAQTERLHELWQRRQHLAALYDKALSDTPRLQLPVRRADSQHAWHLYPVRWRGTSVEKRDQLLWQLRQQGIHLSLHYKPLHLHPAYKPYLRHAQRFPSADQAWEETFSLPLWPELSDTTALHIAETIKALISSDTSKSSI